MLSLVRLMACWFIHQVNELRLWRVTLNATFPRSSTLVCCGFTLNERIQRRKPTSMFISFFLIKSKNVMILHTSTGVQDANPPICRVVHSTAFPSSNEILITHILSWYKSQMFWLLLMGLMFCAWVLKAVGVELDLICVSQSDENDALIIQQESFRKRRLCCRG